jgi:TPR repeat protein
MRSFRHLHWVTIFSIFLAALLAGCGSSSRDEVIAKCDALASHPHDMERHAVGVADDQIIPGAAIEACEHAVKVSPDLARVRFELGRAYWSANRDSDALLAFSTAAKAGYAPAMKYIGDAYLEGRGLPSRTQADTYKAIEWYKQSGDAGFSEGKQAFQETSERLSKLTLDESAFNKGNYIHDIYYNTSEDGISPIFFTTYVQAFVEELGGDKLLYVDQQCRPLINQLGLTALNFAQMISLLPMFKDQNSLIMGGLSMLGSDYAKDFGVRDATALVDRYGCKSPVTKRILQNIPSTISKVIDTAMKEGNAGSPTQQ